MSAAYSRRLLVYILVGFAGVGGILGGGMTDDWLLYGLGMAAELSVVVLLGTGTWMRWPRAR